MPRHDYRRKPPLCPNPDCNSQAYPSTWRYKKKGYFEREAAPQRIQRYVCRCCGRNFSSQTFSPTYWLRRPELLRSIFYRSLACSGLRQITHETGTSHSTIARHLARLGRHCMLFHERLRPELPREPLVLDGFRSMESGHYWPFDLNLLVGSHSHFVYGFNEAPLRRSGTMRPGQRRHRARLEEKHGRPLPQAFSSVHPILRAGRSSRGCWLLEHDRKELDKRFQAFSYSTWGRTLRAGSGFVFKDRAVQPFECEWASASTPTAR